MIGARVAAEGHQMMRLHRIPYDYGLLRMIPGAKCFFVHARTEGTHAAIVSMQKLSA